MPAVWIDLIAKLKGGGVTWINMREWFTLWFKVENEPKQDSIPVGCILLTCQPYMLQCRHHMSVLVGEGPEVDKFEQVSSAPVMTTMYH